MRAPHLTRGRGDPVALIAALVRVAVVPVAVIGQRWTQPPGTELELLEVVFPIAAAYALLTLAVALYRRHPTDHRPFVVADLVLLSLIAYGAGGAEAHIRFAFGIPPIVAAFLGRPLQTAVLAVATVACFLVVVVLAPTVGEPTPARTDAIAVIDLAWRNALVVAMSVLLAHREERIRRLAESRRVLVTQSLRAEDRARRELAYVLHDDVVQSLLSVRQDLTSAARGRGEAIGRARDVLESTVGALRDEISHLHPHQLETLGLPAALRAVAAQKARAGGFAAEVHVADDAPGDHDDLVLALARVLQQLAREREQEVVVRAGGVVCDVDVDREAAHAGLLVGHGALRDEISHLHPHQLETLGLEAALRAVAAQKARAGGFAADVHVADDAPGDHNDLVLALARELLQNAAKHASARRVRLEVTCERGAVVLLCADDGCGCDEDRRSAALRDGHLGLAACTERVEAIGGVMEVRSAPGQGTVVRAALPPTALLRSPRSFNRVP